MAKGAAAAGNDWNEAEAHFENEAGDRERAHRLPTEARAAYEEIGMPRHVEMLNAMLDEAS